MQTVNLAQKLSQIGEYWRPKVVGELNGQEVVHATLTAPMGDRI